MQLSTAVHFIDQQIVHCQGCMIIYVGDIRPVTVKIANRIFIRQPEI